MSDSDSEIDQILHALGEMIAAWAHLEDGFYNLLRSLMGDVDYDAFTALRNELDFKTAVAVAKNTALLRTDLACKEHVLTITKWIDQRLRPERNRLIHDPIYADAGGFSRHQYGTKVVRPQAFEEKIVVVRGYPVSRNSIAALTTCIRSTEAYAGGIMRNIYDDPDEPEPIRSVEALREALAAHIDEYARLVASPEH